MRGTFNHWLVVTAAAFLASGCSTNQRIDTVKIGDNNLSCDQLLAEIQQLEAARSKAAADGNKNELMTYGALGALILAPVTGGASLLVAGAAAAGGYAGFETSGQDKLSAETAHARAQHLTTLFNSKGCRAPVAPNR